ncbi:exopolysaccharide biosynthesis protein [Opitutus sp. ER46]|uniref:exopolysaccharide biosynthesis protein n=1 Tax=Opitutus sp. ER46 TaxID=2161864 RepID=UPI001304F1B6|nr:exopolysaccharide biosynthesis protein [Opitutus sp. ER46]
MNLALPSPRPRPLSEQLEELRVSFADRHATLREVIERLEGRAYTLLLIVFALPFIAPVSIPGSSTPLGLIIAILAAQMAFGKLPWLPRRVLDWQLPAGFFTKLIPVTARIVRRLERLLHPRWPAWTSSASLRAMHFGAITITSLLLSVPIFVPLTNMIPGWTILLLAAGWLERDGIVLLVGHVAFLVTLAFFALLGTTFTEAILHGWHWFTR